MTKYLSTEEVIEIHQILINEFDGSDGLRDLALLEAAVIRPMNGYYNGLIEEATALTKS
jgi:prophage maintenance system killer protein